MHNYTHSPRKYAIFTIFFVKNSSIYLIFLVAYLTSQREKNFSVFGVH